MACTSEDGSDLTTSRGDSLWCSEVKNHQHSVTQMNFYRGLLKQFFLVTCRILGYLTN